MCVVNVEKNLLLKVLLLAMLLASSGCYNCLTCSKGVVFGEELVEPGPHRCNIVSSLKLLAVESQCG